MSHALSQLLQQGQVWRAGQQTDAATHPRISSGHPELDPLLQGGWQPGNLIELLYRHEGCGELRLLLPLLAQLSHQPRWIIWVDPPHQPFAPALAAAGIDISRLLVVRSKDAQEPGWVLEQALKSGGCSAVLGWLKRPSAALIRRLQVAAGESAALGFLFQRETAQVAGSAAAYRLRLQPQRRGTAVTLLKRRQGWPLPPRTLDLGQHYLVHDQDQPLEHCR